MSVDPVKQRLYDPEAATSSGDVDLARSLSHVPRVAAQVVGILLILGGAYYSLSVLIDVLRVAHDPASLAPAVAAMAEVLDLDQAALKVIDQKLTLGQPAAVSALVVWYVIAAWVALSLVGIGGRLVLGVSGERREFLAAMREFLAAVRREEPLERRPPRSPPA